jgi:hypothetical protein
VDPLADVFEYTTSYSYALNNPIMYVDPNGDSTVHVDDLNWNSFNPNSDDVLLNPVVVRASRNTNSGTQVMNQVSGFWGWFDQVWNGNRTYYDGRSENYKGVLQDYYNSVMGTPPDIGISKGVKLISWSSLKLSRIAGELQNGKKVVRVASKAEAEELFLRIFQGKGFKNTSGKSAKETKDFFGKASTYNWDDAVDSSGRILNHSASNAHDATKHLQIHDEIGNIIRIFFE